MPVRTRPPRPRAHRAGRAALRKPPDCVRRRPAGLPTPTPAPSIGMWGVALSGGVGGPPDVAGGGTVRRRGGELRRAPPLTMAAPPPQVSRARRGKGGGGVWSPRRRAACGGALRPGRRRARRPDDVLDGTPGAAASSAATGRPALLLQWMAIAPRPRPPPGGLAGGRRGAAAAPPHPDLQRLGSRAAHRRAARRRAGCRPPDPAWPPRTRPRDDVMDGTACFDAGERFVGGFHVRGGRDVAALQLQGHRPRPSRFQCTGMMRRKCVPSPAPDTCSLPTLATSATTAYRRHACRAHAAPSKATKHDVAAKLSQQ